MKTPPPASLSKRRLILLVLLFVVIEVCAIRESFASPAVVSHANKATGFDKDPSWTGLNNRPTVNECKQITNDFGYQATTFAGPERGELGGTVWRSTQYRAYYGKEIPSKTFASTLSASGSINIPAETNGSVYFGWFNSETSTDFRPSDVIVMRFDGKTHGFTGEVTYGTRNYQVGGDSSATTLAYNTRHNWTIDYAPSGNTGKLTMTLDDIKLEYTVPALHFVDGLNLNRFGFLNQQLDGNPMEIYIDDLSLDGQAIDLDTDPAWEGHNTKLRAQDCLAHHQQNFGYSLSSYAGGHRGEIGGLIWRDSQRNAQGIEVGRRAWYADKVNNLSLNTPLYAKGKIRLTQFSVDADMNIGWFNSKDALASNRQSITTREANTLLLNLGGPTRSGPRLYPMYHTGEAASGQYDYGDPKVPLLNPHGSSRTFSICYLPDVDRAGNGRLTVKVSADRKMGIPASEISMKVPKAHRNTATRFDRFGFQNVAVGGHSTTAYLDDLRYTTAPGDQPPGEDCGKPRKPKTGTQPPSR